MWLNTYMIASAKEIDALNITLFNSCINFTNVHLCNYCTKIFVIIVNTCVCRRSVDNKALILSYPMGVIIWAKQVCATQKAFCVTYSRTEQKIYIFLGEGYISLHSDSQSSVGEVISSLSQSQEQGSYSYKEYIIPKERKGKNMTKRI